jgi:multiple sugar transport system ATP-binding protein
MTMGHRVAVLKDGILQQCDTPSALYHYPTNLFVAGFIGSPAMNLVPMPMTDGTPMLGDARLVGDPSSLEALGRFTGERVVAGFRPEGVSVGDGPLNGRIRVAEDLGSEVFVHVLVDHEGSALSLVAKVAAPFAGRAGDNIAIQLTGTVHLFDPSGDRLATGTARLER